MVSQIYACKDKLAWRFGINCLEFDLPTRCVLTNHCTLVTADTIHDNRRTAIRSHVPFLARTDASGTETRL
jgi:hypothetical protein